jgi:O-antigen/teichoic acid export membrane protein
MIRNIAFLFGSNAASWIVSLGFWLVVPRLIGPAGWGEYNLGFAIGALAFSIGGLGIMTFVVKEIARDRARSRSFIGASMATHLGLLILIGAGVILLILVGPYSAHTRSVVLLMAAVGASTFVVAPTFNALQALERMRLASIVYTLRQVTPTVAAGLVALIFRPDITVLIVVMLIANVILSLVQLGIVNRIVPVKLVFDRALTRQLIVGGLPFWSNSVLVTFYIWIDSVLLSMLTSTREVGFYAAPAQVIATLGFLPAVVTFAIFPALSSSFHVDFERVRRLTRVSLSVLISLGVPMSIGIALIGPKAIQDIFGPAYGPSGPAMVVLAFTVVLGYVATLAFYVLAAVDRQRSWAFVMGGVAVMNPLLNLILIPYFQARAGHGSIGAATALLITDLAVATAGIALIPRECLKPVGPLLTSTLRVALATLAMAIPVWLLRDFFLPIPILAGVAVFTGAAFGLGVFRGEGYVEAWALIKAKLGRRLTKRPEEVSVPA